MGIKTKVTLITIFFAVPAFFLGEIIWPPAPEFPKPNHFELSFFLILSILEAVAFGLGYSLIFLGLPLLKKRSGYTTLTKLAYFSVVWYLINWWPHDNMHAHNGLNPQGLLIIEYLFHSTLIIAGAILALYFYKVVLKGKFK
ncbi:hypothetical protein HYS93_04440 [Candidatus Daviesbacteria bacterium]|nr:hypothetical protein [Candidatus Daviesbacteria bacterium]